jgi:hypothetical protein
LRTICAVTPAELAHTLTGDAVVGGHDDDGSPPDGRVEANRHARQVDGQVEQSPHRPVGHGELLQTVCGALAGVSVGWSDRGYGLFKAVHGTHILPT